jgi:hypothetical protein
MERLSHLDSLPVGDLHYFAGDVPNGAAVELDDSPWQTIRVPSTASSGEVWLRKWGMATIRYKMGHFAE